MLDTLKTLSINGIVLKDLRINNELVWEEPISYKNWVQYSTETDGTLYNSGLGYKNGYRVRSGGAESAQSTNVCTGFIPCKAGDIVRVLPSKAGYSSELKYLNFSDVSKTNIGQLAFNGQYGIFKDSGYTWSNVKNVDGVFEFTVPTDITSASDIAFIRVTIEFAQSYETDGKGMIVTINQEII